jgi:hypothetical protein
VGAVKIHGRLDLTMSHARGRPLPERSFSLPRSAPRFEMPRGLGMGKPASPWRLLVGQALEPHSTATVVEKKGRVVVRPSPATVAVTERSTADAVAAIAATQLHTLRELHVRLAPSVLAARITRARGTTYLLGALLVASFALGFILDLNDGFRAGRMQAAQMMRALHDEPTWERKPRAPPDDAPPTSRQGPPETAPARLPATLAPRPARAPSGVAAARSAPETPAPMIPTFDVSQLPRAPGSAAGVPPK